MLNFAKLIAAKATQEIETRTGKAQISSLMTRLAIAGSGSRIRTAPVCAKAATEDKFEAFTLRERGMYSIRPAPGATCYYARTA